MAEPTVSAATFAAASGIAIFGVPLGLHLEVMFAGVWGALWALSYQPPMPFSKRIAVMTISSVVAGYSTPVLLVLFRSMSLWPSLLTDEIAQFLIALGVGHTAYYVLGPAALKFAAKKAEDLK